MDTYTTFNCNGKVNCKDWQLNKESLFLNCELENVLYPLDDYPIANLSVELFGRTVPGSTAIFHLKHFTKCMEMQLKVLSSYEGQTQLLGSRLSDNIDFYLTRREICGFLLYVRLYLTSIKWNLDCLKFHCPNIEEDYNLLFIVLKRFFSRLKNIPDSTFYYAPGNVGNKSSQPEYHMYHMHLEARWHFFTIVYTRNIHYHSLGEGQADEIDSVLSAILRDLVCISLKTFDRILLTDVSFKTPYNCTCVRELWLMLQIFIDSLSKRIKSKAFWDHVNDCIDELLNKSMDTGENQGSGTGDNSLPFCRNPELFSIWILYHLALLYGYNIDGVYLGAKCSRVQPNHEEIEKILKRYVSKGGKDGERDELDKELSIMIPMINVLVINWWQPRTSIISLLWDCFHKRLNTPFLLQTSGPWTISAEKKTPADILKQVRDRIGSSEVITETSYGIFLRLLGTFLKNTYSRNDTKYWNQMKGRIYSKFSKSKVQEYSESGLYNFLSLFFTLAITTDTANVCCVMLDLLPSTKEFDAASAKKHSLIWKGKLAVLLLYNDLRFNFESIWNRISETVNAISCRKDDIARGMMSHFVDVISTILSCANNVELGEYLFLDGWIDRYLLECSKRMAGVLIKILITVFERCIALNIAQPNLDGPTKMLDALWCYVACRVRQLVFDPVFTNEHYQDLSKLAVLFTLEAVRVPDVAKKNKHSAISLFHHFASSIILKDIRVTRYFLFVILQREDAVQTLKREIKNFEVALIHSWAKCSILSRDGKQSEIKPLEDYIIQLHEIKEILCTSEDLDEFQHSNESILIFIMCSMKKRNSLQTEQERLQFDAKWRQYFNHIEKWILIPINDETKESELAYWIYRCIGTLVLCAAPMLYVKSQTTNMLRILINKTVLLPDQSPQLYLRSLGKKIFSMIILGIETLNVKADLSLQSLIRDLFHQYMPLLITPINNSNLNFKVSDVLLKCFRDANVEFLRFVFELLVANFFTISSDNVMHKHSYLVMVLVQNIIKGDKNFPSNTVEFIISVCTTPVLWCYMKVHEHHPHKQYTIEFMNNITKNSYYLENSAIREKFFNNVSAVILKALTVYQQSTFELLRNLSKNQRNILLRLSPKIEETIKDLEFYRRPNAASLRYSWNQLQATQKNKGKAV